MKLEGFKWTEIETNGSDIFAGTANRMFFER